MAKKNFPSKIESWKRLVGQWRDSGKSVAAFCRDQKVSEPSFYVWRRRLGVGKPARCGPALSKTFLPVTVVPSPEAMAELVLRGGRVLRLHGESSLTRLVELVKALESTGC